MQSLKLPKTSDFFAQSRILSSNNSTSSQANAPAEHRLIDTIRLNWLELEQISCSRLTCMFYTIWKMLTEFFALFKTFHLVCYKQCRLFSSILRFTNEKYKCFFSYLKKKHAVVFTENQRICLDTHGSSLSAFLLIHFSALRW